MVTRDRREDERDHVADLRRRRARRQAVRVREARAGDRRTTVVARRRFVQPCDRACAFGTTGSASRRILDPVRELVLGVPRVRFLLAAGLRVASRPPSARASCARAAPFSSADARALGRVHRAVRRLELLARRERQRGLRRDLLRAAAAARRHTRRRGCDRPRPRSARTRRRPPRRTPLPELKPAPTLLVVARERRQVLALGHRQRLDAVAKRSRRRAEVACRGSSSSARSLERRRSRRSSAAAAAAARRLGGDGWRDLRLRLLRGASPDARAAPADGLGRDRRLRRRDRMVRSLRHRRGRRALRRSARSAGLAAPAG